MFNSAVKFIADIGSYVTELSGKIKESVFHSISVKEIVTLDSCLKLADRESLADDRLKAFFMSVQEPDEKTAPEHNFTVNLVFLDSNYHPLRDNSGSVKGYIFYAATLDAALISFLNGEASAIVRIEHQQGGK